tara:strand:+ start:35786 stop:36376 length:591 start_codon:yes stop_codon:yes gene_type:complete
MQRRALQELVDIQAGYPFRGRLPLSASGDAWVVQFRHIVVGARLNDSAGAGLDRAQLTGRKRPNFLQPGDVLFMAKGTRNDAAAVGDVPANTVCTPNFYHLRLKPGVRDITPDFLAWQLNHRQAQQYFAACCQGSVALSITKSQLARLPVGIPALDTQRQIAKLASAAFEEEQLLYKLIHNRKRQLTALGDRLLNP